LRRSLARKTHLRQPTPRSPRTRTDCRGKTRLARSAACFLKNGHAEARSRGGRQPPSRQEKNCAPKVRYLSSSVFPIRPRSNFYLPLGDLASWRLIVLGSASRRAHFLTPRSRSDRLCFPRIVVHFRANDAFACAKSPLRRRNWTATSRRADALHSVARLR
jgi:hypothetical protein